MEVKGVKREGENRVLLAAQPLIYFINSLMLTKGESMVDGKVYKNVQRNIDMAHNERGAA